MRQSRPTHRRRRSGGIRAVLALGMLLGVSQVGTLASWTDSATISGGTFTSGTLDIKANGQDSYSATQLSMAAMVPGSSSAEVITIRNGGTARMKYTLTGGLSGTDVGAYSGPSGSWLLLTIKQDATPNSGTCSGGSVVLAEQALTSTTSTLLVPKRPAAPMAPSATEALCFQVRLSPSAPDTLQGRSVTATFTATATSDVS